MSEEGEVSSNYVLFAGALVAPWRLVRGTAGEFKSLELTAPYGADEGEELLLPYGLETNLELLASYGFTLPGCSNEAEYVELFKDFDDLAEAAAEFLAKERAPFEIGNAMAARLAVFPRLCST